MCNLSIGTFVIFLIKANAVTNSETLSAKRVLSSGGIRRAFKVVVVADDSQFLIVAAVFSSTLSSTSRRRCRSGRDGRGDFGGGRSLDGGWNGNGVGVHGSSFLVDSDPIDLHDGVAPSRSDGGGQGLRFGSEKVSSDGHVDKEEERLIEGLSNVGVRVLSFSRVPVSSQTSGVGDLSVDEPLNLVLFPDDSEGVEVVAKVKVEVHGSRSNVSIVGPGSSIVKGVGNLLGSLSSIFHDVDLSTGSPSSVYVISWEHPECRPQVVSLGEFGTNFESSVFPGGGVFGVHSTGGVLSSSVVFDSGMHVQETVLNVDVVVSGSVALQLVVGRLTVILELPLGSVHSVSVEFVAPHELVVFHGRGEEGQR